MNAFLLVTLLALQPEPLSTVPLDTLFRHQHTSAIHDIRIDIQADLEHRGARFFTMNGGLRQQLEAVIVVKDGLAAR